jgi:protein TonB
MDTNHTSIENFNELVFENRHKEYGAYAIRKSYNENITLSLFLSLAFFGIIVLAGILFTKNNLPPIDKSGNLLIVDSLFSVPVDLTPEKLKDDEPKKKVEDYKPKSDDLNYKPVDTKTENTSKTNSDVVIVKDGTPEGKDTAQTKETHDVIAVKKPEATNTEPKPWVDEMPDFADGISQYISNNLQYPRMAVENGTAGIVYLSFVVEKDGSVTNIKVLKGIGDGCEQEAMRVLKAMPKWKPGKSHGEPQRVLFNLPVRFRLK